MDIYEKEAIINYLEYNLVHFLGQTEKYIDPDAMGDMYDRAYQLLNDIDRTLEMQVLLNTPKKDLQALIKTSKKVKKS